jgi:TolA-binding protein
VHEIASSFIHPNHVTLPLPVINVGDGKSVTDILLRDLRNKSSQIEELDMQLQDHKYEIEELQDENDA